MKKYKVVNILSPTSRVIFIGSYIECIKIKNKMGFGYSIAKNYL